MDAFQFIGIAGIVALVAVAVYLRKRKPNRKIINAARERARARSEGTHVSIPFNLDEVSVKVIDPAGELTPSQFATLQLMEEGLRPEIKRTGYKYTGQPRNRAAGVPDSYGSEE